MLRLLTLLCLLCVSCVPPASEGEAVDVQPFIERGLAGNERRRAAGLQVIGEHWEFVGNVDGVRDSWRPRSNTNPETPIKTLYFLRDGSIHSETERYVGEGTVIVDSQEFPESLLVTYTYGSDTLYLSYRGRDRTIERRVDDAIINDEMRIVIEMVREKWGVGTGLSKDSF